MNYELTGDRRSPLRVCEYFNIISAENYYILSRIQRRQQATALPRRRLHRIVRNSLWLSLTHYATPPFPQKSRSACLLGCKRPHDGLLSLPTFADFGQPQGLSLRVVGIFQSVRSTCFFSIFTLHFSLFSAVRLATALYC